MADDFPTLKNPPIVEAVVDIDCDLPPSFELRDIEEKAKDAFAAEYPELRKQYVAHLQVEYEGEELRKNEMDKGLHAFQFLQADQKQLVQVRAQGFSFNRLQPYSSLDEYMPEIERLWKFYAKIAEPLQIERVQLRYINRISLMKKNGGVELNDYFKIAPQLSAESNLAFNGFLVQSMVSDVDTKEQGRIALTTESDQVDRLTFVFDIATQMKGTVEVDDWSAVAEVIALLRNFKNRIFYSSVTDQCLQQFQN